MKKGLLLFVTIFNLLQFCSAQVADLSKLDLSKNFSVHPIILNDTLEGYYILSFDDEVSETVKKYSFNFYDVDLKFVRSLDYTLTDGYKMGEHSFNGNTICFISGNKDPNTNITTSQLNFLNMDGQINSINLELNYSRDRLPSLRKIITPVKNKGFLLHPYRNNHILDGFTNEGRKNFSKSNQIFCKVIGSKILVAESDSLCKNLGPTDKINYKLILFDFDKQEDKNNVFIIKHEVECVDYPLDFIQYGDNYYLLKAFYFRSARKGKYISVNFEVHPKSYKLYKYDLKGELIDEITLNGKLNDNMDKPNLIKNKSEVSTQIFALRKMYIYNDSVYLCGEKYDHENSSVEFQIMAFDMSMKNQNIHRFNSAFNQDFSVNSFDDYVLIKDVFYYFDSGYPDFINSSTPGIEFFNQSFATSRGIAFNYCIGDKKENPPINVFGKKMFTKFTIESLGILNDSSTPYFSKLQFEIKSPYYEILPAKAGYICIFEFMESDKKMELHLEKFDF